MARFEPERRKAGEAFTVKKWWWEPEIEITPTLMESIEAALERFSDYLAAENNPDNMKIIMDAK